MAIKKEFSRKGYGSKLIDALEEIAQSNKIKKALTVFDTIDPIDTISLAKKISIKSDKGKNTNTNNVRSKHESRKK